MKKLTQKDIQARRTQLDPAWELREDSLYREFQFRDFVKAFSFMTSVALLAERAGHHPDWHNVYNKVRVSLSTHDAGGLTEKDFSLAEEMDSVVVT